MLIDPEKNNLNIENEDDRLDIPEENNLQDSGEVFREEEESFRPSEENENPGEYNSSPSSSGNDNNLNPASYSGASSFSHALTIPSIAVALVGTVTLVGVATGFIPSLGNHQISNFLSRSTELGFEVAKDESHTYLLKLYNNDYDVSEEVTLRNQFVFTDLIPNTTYDLCVYDVTDDNQRLIYKANYLTKSHDSYTAEMHLLELSEETLTFSVDVNNLGTSYVTVEILGDNSKRLYRHEGSNLETYTVNVLNNSNIAAKISVNGEMTHFAQLLNPDHEEDLGPWLYDENTHWHDKDGEKVDESEHIYKDEVIKEATFEEEGLVKHSCTVCDYSYEEVTDKKEHTYNPNWDYDDTHHWHSCLDEGYEDLKSDYAEHNCVETERIEPTYDLTGQVIYTCECGYSYYEELPRLEHTYSDEWSFDEYEHWHACLDEGYEDLKGDVADHTFDESGYCECGATAFLFELNSSEDGYILTGVNTNISFNWTNLSFPETYNELPVVDISSKIFTNGGVITASFPSSFTHISAQTFYGCSTMESITLPFVGSSISPETTAETFFGYIFGTQGYGGSDPCYWVDMRSYDGERTLIPESLTTINVNGGTIADHALRGLYKVENITLTGVTSIGSYAFADYTNQGSSSIQSISIDSSVISIGANAFDNNPLTELTFNGTIAEWEDVNKDGGWNTNSSLTVIHCNDGDVSL